MNEQNKLDLVKVRERKEFVQDEIKKLLGAKHEKDMVREGWGESVPPMPNKRKRAGANW